MALDLNGLINKFDLPVGFSTERKAYLLFIYILNNDSLHITKKVLLLLLLVLYTKQQHLEFS